MKKGYYASKKKKSPFWQNTIWKDQPKDQSSFDGCLMKYVVFCIVDTCMPESSLATKQSMSIVFVTFLNLSSISSDRPIRHSVLFKRRIW